MSVVEVNRSTWHYNLLTSTFPSENRIRTETGTLRSGRPRPWACALRAFESINKHPVRRSRGRLIRISPMLPSDETARPALQTNEIFPFFHYWSHGLGIVRGFWGLEHIFRR